MAEDLMGYSELMERALKGVVRAALDLIADDGLPGDHHMYISFRTEAPGVEISSRLKAQYPEEMTIVLQHQFWGLETDDDGFEVTLSFGGISERLVVPWPALVGFVDPSVEFGLRFGTDFEAVLEGEIDEDETDDVEAEDTEDKDSEAKDSGAKDSWAGDSEDKAGKTGDVVTLDSFRKK
jgi:hypothetical protein